MPGLQIGSPPRFRASDIMLACFVLVITTMLLVPLPTTLLDFLLVINISFSLLLLLVGLYMPNALALLAFPTLLLLSTLFRLSLNVASTRLILSIGEAGHVIQAFGTFLIQDQVVVGMIIFLIITAVNFIVIARGSARVSEVAARFALDALPGKQLAIDSELRSNLITPDEARRQRDNLRKESQLYGAMDGSMKFVQGDAVAGLFIIVTNIVGGMYQGLFVQGKSFADAVQTYTVLTVGDGLVTQVPALLISICAGIVVTRVSSNEASTLGTEVEEQLFGRPGLLLFVGILLGFIALLPGLPALPFLSVGAVVIGWALLIQWRSRYSHLPNAPLEGETRLYGRATFRALPSPKEDAGYAPRVVIELDAESLYPLYASRSNQYSAFWRGLAMDFQQATGLHLPEVLITAQSDLGPSHYVIRFGERVLEAGMLDLDSLFVEPKPLVVEALGLELVRPSRHPLTGGEASWIVARPGVSQVLAAGNLRSYDVLEWLGLVVAAYFLHTPEELLSTAEVHVQLREVQQRYPGFLEEVLQDGFITLPRLAEIVKGLLREGVLSRDFRAILEQVASFTTGMRRGSLADAEFDAQELVSHVKRSWRRELTSSYLSARGTLRVVVVDEGIEDLLREGAADNGSHGLALEPGAYESLMRSFRNVTNPLLSKGLTPVVLVCDSDVRAPLVTFLNDNRLPMRAFGYEEIDPLVRVEQVGKWEL